ncbi:MAG: DMT family transporter [Gammaproteobacteria bacterium]|nr:DMT family transporter [Gammaproteobacteria bacterium]
MTFRTILATTVAMLAFAANSVLCRLALGDGAIDAASFATIRVAAGAVTLGVIVLPRWLENGRTPADWRTVLALYIYMAFFAFAYLSLSAGTGALILFGAVQLTMFAVALRRGDRFSGLSWTGLVLALAGLVYLVSPGVTAPDPLGALLMAVAGIAWGSYSLLGKGAADPLEATSNNFLWSIPLVLATSLLFAGDAQVTRNGILLAILSGAVASGLGYVIWFYALRGLAATQAATVQLSVPVIAACGGVLLLAESLTLRLVIASLLTPGGIALVLSQRTAR